MIVYALLLIIMMLVRPQGLFGMKITSKKAKVKKEIAKLIMDLLKLNNCTIKFGGLTAVDNLSIHLLTIMNWLG